MAKTWEQKFNNGRLPVIENADKKFGDVPAGVKFLISTPKEINDYIRSIPKGRSVSFQTMKKDIALQHNVEYMCPLTAGIFTRIVSELAYEQLQAGQKDVTPFWRVVDPKMPLAKKLSCGPDFVQQKRMEERIA
jgi:hypothetical protein